jgi:hypothetical protein
MRKENPKYAIQKIHSNTNEKKYTEKVKEPLSDDESEIPKLFIVRGKPDFTVDLSEYNWRRINTPTLEQKKFFQSTPGYKEHKELIIYGGPQGIAVVQANYKKDKHKVDIYLNNCAEDSNDKIKGIKSMFELEWELPLEDPKNHSGLLKKIKTK